MNILAGNFLGTHDVDQRGDTKPVYRAFYRAFGGELVLLLYIILLKTMLLILFNTMDQ